VETDEIRGSRGILRLRFGTRTIFIRVRTAYLQRLSTDKFGAGTSFIRALPKSESSVNEAFYLTEYVSYISTMRDLRKRYLIWIIQI
jgi:hypothetical protein